MSENQDVRVVALASSDEIRRRLSFVGSDELRDVMSRCFEELASRGEQTLEAKQVPLIVLQTFKRHFGDLSQEQKGMYWEQVQASLAQIIYLLCQEHADGKFATYLYKNNLLKEALRQFEVDEQEAESVVSPLFTRLDEFMELQRGVKGVLVEAQADLPLNKDPNDWNT